jgi:hypothetical protein
LSNPENYRFLIWPLVALLLGGWGIVWLRGPLGRLVDRLGITYKGKRFQAQTASEVQEVHGEQPPPPSVAASFFDPGLLGIFRQELEKELESKKVLPGPAREREVLDFAAAAVIIGFFERTYLLIFGSQIAALQALNSAAGEGGFPVDILKTWYELGVLKGPELYANYSFDQWLGFLESAQLVARLPDNKVTISINGRGFLKYLIHQGYALEKVL